jgi:hypothetical protein
MCFSATASFTSAALLIPAGIYCLKTSSRLDQRYWAFAILPLIFGIQQLVEGGIWLALNHDRQDLAHYLGLIFLLFSHIFWLGWIAFSSYLTESSPLFRRLFLLVSISGVLFGIFMYVPLIFNPEWLTVSVVKHSIHYDLVFLSDDSVSQHVIGAAYAVIILVPLMLSSDRYHSVLGVMIFISGLITLAFYGWAFISVWCYFAAIISLYVLYIVMLHTRMVPLVSLRTSINKHR